MTFLFVLRHFSVEGAIRGHEICIKKLVDEWYMEAEPNNATIALSNYWMKTYNRFDYDKEEKSIYGQELKVASDTIASLCFVCSKNDPGTVTRLQRCKKCKFYHYCSRECQAKHWNELNHEGECKQLAILNKYHKPYAKKIRKKIICRYRPCDMPALQALRAKLGLTRPREEYTDFSRDFQIPHSFVVARNDGTMHIGSTPEKV